MKERKYKNGDKVLMQTGPVTELNLIVVDAELCLKGWRYELAFPKKDGTPSKKMTHRHSFEENLKPIS